MYAFEQVESTNVEALRLAELGTPHGTVILANHQTAGKGRLGRTWHSPANTNLYASLILTQKPHRSCLSWIPLTTGVAVAEAIEAAANLSVSLKWPNDIVLGNKKLGGILCESSTKGPSAWNVIVGIGINVNWEKEHFPGALKNTATSLAIEAQHQIDRRVLFTTLLSRLETNYERLLSSDLSSLQSSYVSRSSTIGRHVHVQLATGETIDGFAINIGSEGELQVNPSATHVYSQAQKPSVITIRAGDVIHVR